MANLDAGYPESDARSRRRARARIDVDANSPLPYGQASGRRLSDEERRWLQERARRWEQPVKPEADQSPPAVTATTLSPSLTKPVPRMPKQHGGETVRSRGMVALAALLVAGLTIIAFAGGRLFGSAPPTPPVATEIASIFETPVLSAASTPLAAVVSDQPMTAVAGGPRKPIVCLDPGHGGDDRGFMRPPWGYLASLEEAPMVLNMALELETRLEQDGVTVVMTRTTDASPNPNKRDINGDGKTAADDVAPDTRYATLDDLQARINVCNNAAADLLVSMHINGFTTPTPFGFETWFTRERPFGAQSSTFASLAYAHLKDQLRRIGYVMPAEERGVNPDSVADVQKEHSVFKHMIMTGPAVPGAVVPSEMPGAIVETLFISNDGDADVLNSADGQSAIVAAYENAILEYFERNPVEDTAT